MTDAAMTAPTATAPADQAPADAPRKRERKTVDAAVLQRACERHGMTPAEISESMGLSSGAVAAWIKEGKAPVYAGRHCELLDLQAAARGKTFLVKVPAARVEDFRALVAAMGERFGVEMAEIAI